MANNTLIIGDSYSTYEGCVPEGYGCYYIKAGRPNMDVTKLEETWWYQVFEEKNLKLVLNESWAGTTVGHTGYNGEDCSQTKSFVYRLDRLIESGFFAENRIDTVFIFGGTNDHWAKAPVGEVKFEDLTKQDLYSAVPAMCYILQTLRKLLPEADIYCICNSNLNPDMVAGFEAACDQLGVNKVVLQDIDKSSGHPTIKGMQAIRAQVLDAMNNHQGKAE